MHFNYKKLFPLLTLSLGFCSLQASEEARLRNLENRLTSLENSQSGCCVINPPARPYSSECFGFYAVVDPLLWQAHINGLPLSITANSVNFFSPSDTNEVKNLNFDWDFGFRLGVGINTNHDAWDTLLQWTYWSPNGRKEGTGINFLTQTHPSVTADQTAAKAAANWHMNYNMVDLQNGREFYVSKYLTIRPYAGLRTAWIKQHFNVNYTDITSADAGRVATFHEVKQTDSMWGIGLLGGMNLQWGLGCGWSLFSNYDTSLLYSYHKVQYSEEADALIASTFSVKDFFHTINAIFDMQLGFQWDWISCDEALHFGADLGWELHLHPGQNQFLNFVSTSMNGKLVGNQGDLGIQGYFVRLRVDF